MKLIITLFAVVILLADSFPQEIVTVRSEKDVIGVPKELEIKIGSGELIKSASEKKLAEELALQKGIKKPAALQTAIYLSSYPNGDQINRLKALGINVLPANLDSFFG